MFRGLIDDAKLAISEIVARYTTRAVIGAFFAVAIGFAVAAITVQLVARFGAITAFWMIAGGFAVIGLIGLALENLREQQEVQPAAQSEKSEMQQVAATAATEAAVQLPIALIGSMLTGPAGPISALSILRLLGRNFPLIVLLVGVGILLWPQNSASQDAAETSPTPDQAAA